MRLQFLFFLLVMLTLSLGTHSYLAWRLSAGVGPGWTRAIWALAALNLLVMFGGMALARGPLNGGNAAVVLGNLAYTAMGFWSLTLALVLFVDIGRVVWSGVVMLLPALQPELDPTRRALLANVLNMGVGGTVAGLGLLGLRGTRRGPEVVEVEVPIPGLPSSLDGFTIVQLSDIHIGPTIRGPFLEKIVKDVNQLGADMVAITGDLVDGSVAQLRDHVASLAHLQSRHGTLFITGNHEYYSGVHQWVEHLTSLGVRVLLNEHEVLDHDGATVMVAGVTDLHADRIEPAHTSDAGQACTGAPEDCGVRILLAHQPGSAFDAQKQGFHLQLSGHTHGGQYFPGNILVHLAQPFVAGLDRLEDMWVYVNRGTGWWGPPFRFPALSEITLLKLVKPPMS